jgi:FAD/FMN-containing dehydrogenase
MPAPSHQSWGRYPQAAQKVFPFHWRAQELPSELYSSESFLPYGNGRSYGDSCLNDGGALLDCRKLNRFIHFCEETGLLKCEAGVLLSEVLQLAVPRGWFPPVTPGTRFVTLGGALANDIHGKNHHSAGTFSRHVRRFELLRSDGSRILCSPEENVEWFQATAGGLGLTGVITWLELQLKPIHNTAIEMESIRFRDLKEFFQLSQESSTRFEYTVAWVDCLASGSSLGRGLFLRGNHADASIRKNPRPPARAITFPIDPPFALINGLTLRLFNALYYRKQLSARTHAITHYEPFFYPLDAIHQWNRIYGNKGLLQHQCSIPTETSAEAVREMLEKIARARSGSFLAVLKMFGDLPSPGLLSFPIPGATLALDFTNTPANLRLLDSLDETTRQAGGRVNPSKDGRVSAVNFQAFYPHWRQLQAYRDPAISSSFWRRVSGECS